MPGAPVLSTGLDLRTITIMSPCLRFIPALLLLGAGSLPAAPLTIMPVGDSGTIGVDNYTGTSGGYRDALSRDLKAANISFTFVGACILNATPALTASGNTAHNGYGFYRVDGVLDNLDGNKQPSPGDANQGGFWLTGGHDTKRNAMKPDIMLLEIGANDLIQHFDAQTPHPTEDQFLADLEQRLSDLVTKFHALSPNTTILVAQIYPFKHSADFNKEITAYNTYIRTKLVPGLSYTRTVDQYSPFLQQDGSVRESLLGSDNVHPTRYGYPLMALQWAKAIGDLEGSKPTLYPLAVPGGFGDGSYPAGSVVPVEAPVPPAGQQFAGWVPPTSALFNVYWPVALYTMPSSAAKLTAQYAPMGSPVIPDGLYRIVAYWDGLSLGSAASSGVIAQQQTYNGSSTQQWKLTNLGKNLVELTLSGTNLALSVPSDSGAGGKIDVEDYTGGTNQQWTLTPLLGTTEIVNAKTGTAAAILGYQTAPGIAIVQNPAGYIANQTWGFFPIPADDSH